jgi:O-antigen/teichoic acid export membrane protein
MSGTRGIARHTIIYGLGTVLQKGVSFLMLPLYTRLLTPADYGILALIDMTLDVISIGAGAQLAYAIFRFYHKADTDAERHTVVSTVFQALLVSYAVTGGLTMLFADPISVLLFGSTERATLIRIASGGMISQCLLIVPFAFMQVIERSALVTSVSFAKLTLQLGLNVLFLVGFRVGVMGILMSTLLANAIVGISVSVWTIRQVGFSFSPVVLRALVRYAGPMVVTQFATFFATFGDRYFLKAFGGESAVGLYNLSYQFGFLLFAVGFSPFNSMWGPRRFAIAKGTDVATRDRELSEGFGYANLLILAIAVGLALFVGDILHLMTTPPFFASARAVPVILIAYVLLAWCNIQDLGILVRERTEYLTLINWIAFAVAGAGWVILIPDHGALGAAWAGTMSFAVRYALTYRIAQHLWPVRYEWGPTLRMIGVGVALVLLSGAIPPLPLVASIATHSVMMLAYLAFLWRAGALSTELRATILSRARELLRRPVAAAR